MALWFWTCRNWNVNRFVVFWSGIRKNVFGDKGLPPSVEVNERKVMGVKQKQLIPIIAFLSAPLIAFLLSSYQAVGGGTTFLGDQNIVNVIFKLVGFVIVGYLGYILYQASPEERKKVICGYLYHLIYDHILGIP